MTVMEKIRGDGVATPPVSAQDLRGAKLKAVRRTDSVAAQNHGPQILLAENLD